MNLLSSTCVGLLAMTLVCGCSGAEAGQDVSQDAQVVGDAPQSGVVTPAKALVGELGTAREKLPLRDDGARLVPLSDEQIKVVVGHRGSDSVLRGSQLAAFSDGSTEVKSADYYVFGIGNGITNADYLKARAPSGYYGTEPKFPPQSFFEATYSSRLAGAPENLWTTNGAWLQSGGMLDNEQTEVHYYWQHNDFYSYHVDVDYQVSSEANYDYLWINSTSSDSRVCNNPGVVRTKLSGEQTGKVSFDIPAQCPQMWLGIYYIKDYSVSSGGDFARIANVRIYANIPVGI